MVKDHKCKYLTPSRNITLIDIGVREGVHSRWKDIIENYPVSIIGFEPEKDEYERLKKLSGPERYLPYAVFSKKGNKVLHITKSKGSCSFFEPDFAYINRFVPRDNYAVENTVQVEMDTLDAVLKDSGISDIDFIKSDTEGCELEIVNGGTETLKTVFCVELEVWFNRFYKGMPIFFEVDRKMRELGFTLFDLAGDNFIKRTNGEKLGGPKGQLMSGDALYFRDVIALDGDSLFWNKDKTIKCLLICMAFGYLDYALEIIEDPRAKRAFDEFEIEEISSFIATHGKRIPYFKGRYRLSLLLDKLARWFSVRQTDFLGNW